MASENRFLPNCLNFNFFPQRGAADYISIDILAMDAEFAELLTKKKAAYPDYRKARDEMQELVRAQKNVERFFAEEKDTTEKTQIR